MALTEQGKDKVQIILAYLFYSGAIIALLVCLWLQIIPVLLTAGVMASLFVAYRLTKSLSHLLQGYKIGRSIRMIAALCLAASGTVWLLLPLSLSLVPLIAITALVTAVVSVLVKYITKFFSWAYHANNPDIANKTNPEKYHSKNPITRSQLKFLKELRDGWQFGPPAEHGLNLYFFGAPCFVKRKIANRILKFVRQRNYPQVLAFDRSKNADAQQARSGIKIVEYSKDQVTSFYRVLEDTLTSMSSTAQEGDTNNTLLIIDQGSYETEDMFLLRNKFMEVTPLKGSERYQVTTHRAWLFGYYDATETSEKSLGELRTFVAACNFPPPSV